MNTSHDQKEDSDHFPDAASMIRKQDSSYIRLNNQLTLFEKPANVCEQGLMLVSIHKIKFIASIGQGGQGVVKKRIFRGTQVAIQLIKKGKWD